MALISFDEATDAQIATAVNMVLGMESEQSRAKQIDLLYKHGYIALYNRDGFIRPALNPNYRSI